MDYTKYLKYKNKYLMLKNSMMGGSSTTVSNDSYDLREQYKPVKLPMNQNYTGRFKVRIIKFDNPTEHQIKALSENNIYEVHSMANSTNSTDVTVTVDIDIKKDTEVIIFMIELDKMYIIRLFSDMIKPIEGQILPDLSNSFIQLYVDVEKLLELINFY